MTYLYNHSAKELVQKATMEKPHPILDEAGTNYYDEKVHKYEKHLHSLTRYPYEGTPEMDGKEFTIQHQYRFPMEERWHNGTRDDKEVYTRVVAIPIENKSEERRFTVEDLDACWAADKDYLIEILNGDYDLNTAREDLKSLIGSKYDLRTSKTTQP